MRLLWTAVSSRWARARTSLSLKGPTTRVIDLAGDTVVPGLQDAHGHFLGLGASLLDARPARHAESGEHHRESGRAAAPARTAGRWMVGRGWDQNDWPVKEWPTRQPLDAVAPDTPVRARTHRRTCRRGPTARRSRWQASPPTTGDPDGGRVLRDAGGAPTGVFIDTAQALVERHIPPPTPGEIDEQILAADRETRRLGLTMVHDAGASSRDHRGLPAAEPRGTARHAALRDDRLEPGDDTRVVRARAADRPAPSCHRARRQAVRRRRARLARRAAARGLRRRTGHTRLCW